jgi:hypothetical protein
LTQNVHPLQQDPVPPDKKNATEDWARNEKMRSLGLGNDHQRNRARECGLIGEEVLQERFGRKKPIAV